MNLKKELRDHYRQIVLPPEKLREVSQRIISQLKFILPKNVTIGAYKAKDAEPEIEELFTDLNYDWVFPKVEGENLSYWRPSSAHSFIKNEFDILEPDPKSAKEVPLDQISALLIPGLAFDRRGGRLGRGKGYYDRILRNFNGLKVGVTPVEKISDTNLPSEDHDISMDIIVCDQFVLQRFES